MSKSAKVEIFGQSYTVKGEEEPAHLQTVAAYLDAKMKEVASSTQTVPPLKVAILAALTITDECLQHRRRNEQIEQLLLSGTGELFEILER